MVGRPAPIDISAADVAAALESVFPGRIPIEVSPLGGGYVNTVFHVRFAEWDDSFVLRFYRGGERVARIEVALLKQLEGAIPIPEVVGADTGGTLTGHPFVLLRFVDGVLLDRLLEGGGDVTDAAREVGAVLASFHQVQFAQGGFFGGEDLNPVPEPSISVDGIIRFVDDYLQMEVVRDALDAGTRERFRRAVCDAAPLLIAIEGARSLVHADYNGKNILLAHRDGRWHVSAVLDWEFAFAGTPLFDIGNMLRFVDRMPPHFEKNFIAGFLDGGGELPPQWKQISRLLDVYSLCQFLAQGPDGSFYHEARRLVTTIAQRGEI